MQSIYFSNITVKKKTISLVLVLLFPWQSLSESCHSSPYSIPGFKIHGLVIKTLSLSTRSQCEHQCAAKQGCNSISFHQNKGKCELHDGNHVSNPESLLPSDGYTYVNFPARPPKTCSRKLCSYTLACVSEGNSYKCVTCEGRRSLRYHSMSIILCAQYFHYGLIMRV